MPRTTDKQIIDIATATSIASQAAIQAAQATAAQAAQAAAVTSAVVSADISNIKASINEIKDSIKTMQGQYVLRVEFDPIKRVVYGLIAVLGIATLAAIGKLIFIPK